MNAGLVTTICIHCDSMRAQAKAKNGIYNSKSRHIRQRHNTIKQLLSNEIIFIQYVRSKKNIGDHLSKGLSREQVAYTLKGLDLKLI